MNHTNATLTDYNSDYNNSESILSRMLFITGVLSLTYCYCCSKQPTKEELTKRNNYRTERAKKKIELRNELALTQRI